MGRKRTNYKVGDRVKCIFAGGPIEGVIERIEKKKNYFSKVDVNYWVNDGEYKYPISLEKIKGIINE